MEHTCLPRKANFFNINEYDECCNEWKSRRIVLFVRKNSRVVHKLGRSFQKQELRRNLKQHFTIVVNGEPSHTLSQSANGNLDSQLKGVFWLAISTIHTKGIAQEVMRLGKLDVDTIKEVNVGIMNWKVC